MKKILIVGAGGHGRSVAEAILGLQEWNLAGFVDDTAASSLQIWDYSVLGTSHDLSSLRSEAEFAVVAIGNNRVRKELHGQVLRAGFKLATVIHQRAIVASTASIGPGSMIMAGAVVGTEARLGEGVIVNSAAVVDHHCNVHEFAHLGVGAAMAGGTILGPLAWMQAGSAIGYGVTVPAAEALSPGEAREAKQNVAR